MAEPDPIEVAELLAALTRGEEDALDRLMPLIYQQLRVLASRQLKRMGGTPSVSTTLLVHEAYERLVGRARLQLEHERHLMRLCARVMGQIIVDHARERAAAKRGGGGVHVPIADWSAAADDDPELAARLSQALAQLESRDAELAEIAELAWLAGLGNGEIARLTGVHLRQVQRDLLRARAWVMTALSK